MSAPVSRSPHRALQTALYERLSGDTELMALVTGVCDGAPEPQEFPYVDIGELFSVPDNAHGQFGREVTLSVRVWTQTRGNAEGQTIAARIVELLDHQPLEVDGHRVVAVRHEFDQALPDPDPTVRHFVARFRIITAQEE